MDAEQRPPWHDQVADLNGRIDKQFDALHDRVQKLIDDESCCTRDLRQLKLQLSRVRVDVEGLQMGATFMADVLRNRDS